MKVPHEPPIAACGNVARRAGTVFFSCHRSESFSGGRIGATAFRRRFEPSEPGGAASGGRPGSRVG